MTVLFKRVVNVAIAPKLVGVAAAGLAGIVPGQAFDVSNLDCVFNVKKNLKPEPNTCELKIFNLAESTRKILASAERLVLRLEAGYEGAISQLYLGEVRSAHSTIEGPDIVTEISTGDSEKEVATTKISIPVGPKTPASAVMLQIIKELNVGPGNAPIMAGKMPPNVVAMFGNGTIITGKAARALDDICRAADYEWSIQDGVLQILDRGRAVEGLAVLLSPETGLVGSPSVDQKGIVSATALIQPDLRPGRKVVFKSKTFTGGGYRIEDCEYSGDTAGNEWYVKFHAKPY